MRYKLLFIATSQLAMVSQTVFKKLQNVICKVFVANFGYFQNNISLIYAPHRFKNKDPVEFSSPCNP